MQQVFVSGRDGLTVQLTFEQWDELDAYNKIEGPKSKTETKKLLLTQNTFFEILSDGLHHWPELIPDSQIPFVLKIMRAVTFTESNRVPVGFNTDAKIQIPLNRECLALWRDDDSRLEVRLAYSIFIAYALFYFSDKPMVNTTAMGANTARDLPRFWRTAIEKLEKRLSQEKI